METNCSFSFCLEYLMFVGAVCFPPMTHLSSWDEQIFLGNKIYSYKYKIVRNSSHDF